MFEAYDASGALIGQIGPVRTGDYSFSGTTAEDHFFGIIDDGGISRFTIRDPGGVNNLEVDHLQYSLTAVPLPGSLWLLGSGLAALISLDRGRKRTVRKQIIVN